MKKIIIPVVLIALGLLVLFTCTTDVDEVIPISISEMTITIDENQEEGASIGFIDISILKGDLNFSIQSQNPIGASKVDAVSGELIVENAMLFNYELHPSMSLTVTINNGDDDETIDVTIIINDEDDVEHFLMTSKPDYVSAADNTWVRITYGEYHLLQKELLNVSRLATSEDEWLHQTNINSELEGHTVANDNGHIVPASSYIFAFAYYAQTANDKKNKVLLSTNGINGPYKQIGNDLPYHGSGYNFFLLKQSNTPTTSTGYLGFYFTNYSGWKSIPDANTGLLETGLATNLSESGSVNSVNLYQGLSTTTKQW